MKNTCRPRSGSLPSSRNNTTPTTTVSPSASTGDAMDMSRLGAGRTSSFNMVDLLRRGGACGLGPVPEPRHPFPDLLDGRLRRGDARRYPPLRDDDHAVADLEELVELFADHQHGAAGIAQLQQLAADLSGGADVDAPRRLRDDQQLRIRVDLAADDELLQVAARQALRGRRRAARLDVEALDQVPGQ